MPKLQEIQNGLDKVVAFGALPLFAFMSAGVDLSHLPAGADIPVMLVIGILVAMIIGKPLGVIGTTWIVVKSGLGSLPQGVKWKDLIPALLVFGMCFTLAMVMTELSFGENPQLHALANLIVIIASLTVAIISSAALTARKVTRVE